MKELCVVISYYDARPSDELQSLLRQIRETEFDFSDVLVVVNSIEGSRLTLADDIDDVEILYRQNAGFNMGAWDFGWRSRQGYRNYLFLQDECTVERKDWAEKYIRLLSESHGRVIYGESLQYWRSWRSLHDKYEPIFSECQALATAKSIPLGKSPTHLQTLVIAASDAALARLDGFILADEKIRAVATEILFSRHAIACGYFVRQAAHRPFEYFGHPQWATVRRDSTQLRWSIARLLKRALISTN